MHVRDALLPEPVTTTPDEPFSTFVDRVIDSRQATAAVLDADGRLVGLVGMLMEVLHDDYLEERLVRIGDLKVGDLMSVQMDTVELDDSLIKAAAIIVERGRKTLPVVENDRFVGMITRRSLLEHVVRRMQAGRVGGASS
jgi:CBS-domain-containing membrane protein